MVKNQEIPEDAWPARRVYELNVEAQFHRFNFSSQFAPGLKRIRENTKKRPLENKWRNSRCQEILTKMVEKGQLLPDEWPAKRVYNLDIEKEFRKFDFDCQFEPGLERIRGGVSERKKRVAFDQSAFENDRKIYPVQATTERGTSRWCGSVAEKALKEDVDAGRHEEMKPKELYESGPNDYGEHILDSFRDHIYQEARSRSSRAYWKHIMQQKKLAKQKKAAK